METKRVVVASFILSILIASFLIFYDITKRPLHHDEGVIGWFGLNIMNSGSYTYDPDYHGPFQYHLLAVVFKIFGTSDFTLRAPGALFCIGLLPLLWFIRKRLGKIGLIVASMVLATSPTIVYFAQRAYMDMYFLFFQLALVVLFIAYLESRRWWIIPIMGADLALLFSTKETAFIVAFVFLSFLAIEYIIALMKGRNIRKDMKELREWLWENRWSLSIAFVTFTFIYAAIFTTGFLHPQNLWRAIEKSLTFWIHRSTTWEGHFKPYWFYGMMMLRYEPSIILAMIGFIFLRRSTFNRFGAYWTALSFLIYSIIPYKQPWLLPHIILPMAILAGSGAQGVWERLRLRAPFIIALIILFGIAIWKAWSITYIHYSDNDEPMVYVQCRDSLKELVRDVEITAAKADGTNTEIVVTNNAYWPLPWYFRDYKRVAWHGKPVYNLSAPIIISSSPDYGEIKEELRSDYVLRKYDVNPGLYYVYYRKGLWEDEK